MDKRIISFIKEKKQKNSGISIGFLGIGRTNRAIIDIIAKGIPSAKLVLRQNGDEPDDIRSKYPHAEIITGNDAFCNVGEEILFLSPSVRRERLSIDGNTILTSDTEIFFDSERKNCFLVSGSDGKSTVTTLVSELLLSAFPDIFIGGNIGTPLALIDLANTSAFAIELSSFNLTYVKPSSRRAIITGITPNHLNWHASFDEYVAAKRNILERAEEPVLSIDTDVCEGIARTQNSFALCSTALTASEIARGYSTDHAVTLENGKILLNGKPVISIDRLKRREKHNIANLMSAIAMTLGYADITDIERVGESFNGLSHRCERFLELGGIEFIDSSIDTTPERTRVTLEGLDRRVRIILGGRGKGLELHPLIAPLSRYADRIAVYGEMSGELLSFIEENERISDIPHESFTLFDDALDYITKDLGRGDTVLLSPAATGYGEFANFAERGDRFKQYIINKYSKI